MGRMVKFLESFYIRMKPSYRQISSCAEASILTELYSCKLSGTRATQLESLEEEVDPIEPISTNYKIKVYTTLKEGKALQRTI